MVHDISDLVALAAQEVPERRAVVETGGSATVTATVLAGGQPTGVTISAAVVTEGIAAVWGSVATPYELGEYPLISPHQAVQRLSDPRFAGTGPALASPGAEGPAAVPACAAGQGHGPAGRKAMERQL